MLPPIFTIVRIGLLTVATTDQIPRLAGYGPLASLALTRTATLGGKLLQLRI